MSEATSDTNKNSFSDIVDGLSEEHKSLIKERNRLEREEKALSKKEVDLQEAQEDLNVNRLTIEHALVRWSVMYSAVELSQEKLREKKKTLKENMTHVEQKINLFESILPAPEQK